MIDVRIAAPTVVDVRIVWNGLTFGDGLFGIDSFTGWLELPGAQYESQGAPGHGAQATPGVHGPRIVQASGRIWGYGGLRDALISQLRLAMVPRASVDAALDDLAITAAGETRTARAQLTRYAVPMDPQVWASGVVPWLAQWRCPDPRVFGADISAASLLVSASSGLTLPRMLPFTMPAQPIGGQVTVANPGSDPEGSPTVFTLTGAQSGTVGVELVTAGRRVTYALTLGMDDVLVVDTERGGAFLNGEYRSSSGMSDLAADLRLLPGVNVVRALGSAGAGSPSIAVVTRPASW
jgi:hypothetical protein